MNNSLFDAIGEAAYSFGLSGVTMSLLVLCFVMMPLLFFHQRKIWQIYLFAAIASLLNLTVLLYFNSGGEIAVLNLQFLVCLIWSFGFFLAVRGLIGLLNDDDFEPPFISIGELLSDLIETIGKR